MNIFASIKNYFKIARPHLWAIGGMLVFQICIYLIGVYSAIPSANAITSITNSDLNATIFWLLITLGTVVVQKFCNFLINRLYYVNMRRVYTTVHGKIYDKINHASKQGFEQTSTEKILNIVYNNTGILADFPDYFCQYAGYFVQAIVSIVILLSYNFYIGIVIVAVCIILFFLFNFLNKRIAINNNKECEYKDAALEGVTDSINNRDLTRDLNLNQDIKQKFIKNMTSACDYRVKQGNLYSLTENWVPFLYQTIIILCCIYMVVLTKQNIFTLTLYLVLSKYLSSSITKMTDSYKVLDYVQDLHVGTLRIKTVLEMSEDDFLEFGANSDSDVKGNLILTNVSYTAKGDDVTTGIDKFSIKINQNTTNLIYGVHSSGKRSIFYMLRRAIRPTTGTITLGNINIYDFDKEAFKHNIAYTTSNPYFYNDTLMANMLTAGCDKTTVFRTCKELGIHDKIVKTELAYKTNIVKSTGLFNDYDKYVLGIARALCTGASVIMIYETPRTLTDAQKDDLVKLLKKIGKNHTLILFSYNDWLKSICKDAYKVEKGTLKKSN